MGGTLPRLLFAASGLSRQPCIFASSGVSGLVVVNYVLGGLNCWPLMSSRIHLRLQTPPPDPAHESATALQTSPATYHPQAPPLGSPLFPQLPHALYM